MIYVAGAPPAAQSRSKKQNNRKTLKIRSRPPYSTILSCTENIKFNAPSQVIQNLPDIYKSYYRSFLRRFCVIFLKKKTPFPCMGKAAKKKAHRAGRQLCAERFRCKKFSLRSRWCCRHPAGPGPETWSSPEPRPRGSPPGSRPAYRRCGYTCPHRSGRRRGSPWQKR